MRRLVRAWYGVCFVEAMLLALGLRQHGAVYFMVRHGILSGGNRKRMNACPPPVSSKTVCHNGQSAALLSSAGLVMYFSTLPAPSSSAPCILTILTHLRVCVKICILTHPRNSLAQTVAHKRVSRLHPPRFPSMSKVAALYVVEQKLHVVGSVCNWEKCLAGDRGNFTPQPPLRSP